MKFFVNSISAIMNREFFILGQYVGMSIAQGGNGFPFLAPQVFQYIVEEDFCNFKVDVCDLPDGSLKFAVEEILKCRNDDELCAVLALDEICDWIFQMGYSKPLSTLTVADTLDLISILTLYHLMIKVKSSMDHGLQDAQVLDYIRKEPESWKPLFVKSIKVLSSDDFKDLFHVQYSEEGSSRKVKEVDAYVFFSDFLDECYDGHNGCNLEDVVIFFSGSSQIPPLGFEVILTLYFNDDGSTLAKASTCDLSLCLPLHSTYKEFQESMIHSIKGNDGFGNA